MAIGGATPENLGADARGRSFHGLSLPSFGQWPAELVLPTPNFVVLIVADATESDIAAERAAARTALAQGVVYVCSWGPRAGAIEETFDWAFLDLPDAGSRPILMTTQHSAEELAEAVAFFFDLAEPDAAYRITCGAWLIVEVGLFGAASGALDLVRHVLAIRRT